MATFEVSGYGNIFLVKADSDTKAEQIVHDWAVGEGFVRIGVKVTEINFATFA
jgi:ketol-acid reductoisomerase